MARPRMKPGRVRLIERATQSYKDKPVKEQNRRVDRILDDPAKGVRFTKNREATIAAMEKKVGDRKF